MSEASDRREIQDARSYYRRILPFYEKESLLRAHLDFWRTTARRLRPKRILEIGSGLGRITAELSRVAPSVGTDISLEMLSLARRRVRKGAPVLFVAADARRRAFGNRFDLIVAPGDPISHMTSLADRRQTLRAIARQLAPGGHFVLEGLYKRRNEVALPHRRVAHATGTLHIEEAWFPVGTADLWHARYRYRDRRKDGTEQHMSAAFLARAWNPATIRGLFEECGLRIRTIRGDFDGQPFTPASRRIVVFSTRLRA